LGTREKKQKLLVPTPHSKRKKKIGSIMRACWAFALAAWNFYFQNCLFGPFWPGLMAGAENWGQSGNLMGTHWEREENMLGTKGKWKKSSPPQYLREKKSMHFECMLAFPLTAWNFDVPKLFITIFSLG
jgi:hypothetical protein